MKELKVDLFNSKNERVATSIELSKFNIFVGNDFMNINRIMLKSRKNKLLATHTRRYRDWETDRKSTRLNSSHSAKSRMPSSA